MGKEKEKEGEVAMGRGIVWIIAVKGDVLRYIALLQHVDMVIKHGRRVK